MVFGVPNLRRDGEFDRAGEAALDCLNTGDAELLACLAVVGSPPVRPPRAKPFTASRSS